MGNLYIFERTIVYEKNYRNGGYTIMSDSTASSDICNST